MLDPKLAGTLLKKANDEAVIEAAQRLQDIATQRSTAVSITRESQDF